MATNPRSASPFCALYSVSLHEATANSCDCSNQFAKLRQSCPRQRYRRVPLAGSDLDFLRCDASSSEEIHWMLKVNPMKNLRRAALALAMLVLCLCGMASAQANGLDTWGKAPHIDGVDVEEVAQL